MLPISISNLFMSQFRKGLLVAVGILTQVLSFLVILLASVLLDLLFKHPVACWHFTLTGPY